MNRSLLALALLLLTAQPTLAQEAISFQGKLTTPDGTPVADGSHAVRFQLFDTPTGGSPRWGEAHAVTTEGGVFSVVLGTENMLNLNIFSQRLYLLLIVDNEAMEPRVPLTAVPYAMKSYRLDEQALVPGQNVSITRLTDGTLQIGSSGGGGGTGGLTSVASDATLTGNGTSGAPLGIADGSVTGAKLSNGALVAGANVGIVRRGNGSLEISAAGGGGGGLTQVMSDATLTGNGTAGSPLQLADGAVTGMKLADGALVAGANVTITRQAGGAFQVAATGGGGGLTAVTSNATLSGNGTAGSPLRVAVPLDLVGGGAQVIKGQHSNGPYGYLGGSGVGVVGQHPNGSYGTLGASSTGVYGQHGSGSLGYFGSELYGAYGKHANGNTGHMGGGAFGAYGRHANGNYGTLGSIDGVHGRHANGNFGYLGSSSYGAFGQNSNGHYGYLGGSGAGVQGISSTTVGALGGNSGVFGQAQGSDLAGQFSGHVHVSQNLSVSGTKNFKIDHPLDPAGKYLNHFSIESDEVLNVYSGTVYLNAQGEASVVLPAWMEALNINFRYQLTPIGAPGPNLYIAEKIRGNQFKIAGGEPGMEVSWQVTGVRNDPAVQALKPAVEEEKPPREHGYYLHPQFYGQPQERSILWARDPEMMRTIQERPQRQEEERRRMEEERRQMEAEDARIQQQRQRLRQQQP